MPSTKWHSHKGGKDSQTACVSQLCQSRASSQGNSGNPHPKLQGKGCTGVARLQPHRQLSPALQGELWRETAWELLAFPPKTCSSDPEALRCRKISGELGISILKQPWALAISQAGCSWWSLCYSAGVLCCPDFHLWHFPGPSPPMWKAEGLA